MKMSCRKSVFFFVPLFAFAVTTAVAQQGAQQQSRASVQSSSAGDTAQQVQVRKGNRHTQGKGRFSSQSNGSGFCQGNEQCRSNRRSQGQLKGQASVNANGVRNGRHLRKRSSAGDGI